jgi:hypothetical protein
MLKTMSTGSFASCSGREAASSSATCSPSRSASRWRARIELSYPPPHRAPDVNSFFYCKRFDEWTGGWSGNNQSCMPIFTSLSCFLPAGSLKRNIRIRLFTIVVLRFGAQVNRYFLSFSGEGKERGRGEQRRIFCAAPFRRSAWVDAPEKGGLRPLFEGGLPGLSLCGDPSAFS